MTQLHQDPIATTTVGRRRSFWIRRRELIVSLTVLFGPPVLAWVDYLGFGLPPTSGNADPADPSGPHSFPIWVRGSHYLNLLFVVLLLRSGWRIGKDHPRLFWNASAAPGTEWARLNLTEADPDLVRSTRDDPRWYRRNLTAIGWTLTGFVYMALVALTGQWQRILPTTWAVFPEAWHVFVQYSTFHLPLDPDGYWRYNSLQLFSYAVVVFGFCPALILSGLAAEGHSLILSRAFGNREAARSVHVLLGVAYLAFVAVHVFFVVLYGFWLNWNHIVLGTDETGLPGGVIAVIAIGSIALIYYVTDRLSREPV